VAGAPTEERKEVAREADVEEAAAATTWWMSDAERVWEGMRRSFVNALVG